MEHLSCKSRRNNGNWVEVPSWTISYFEAPTARGLRLPSGLDAFHIGCESRMEASLTAIVVWLAIHFPMPGKLRLPVHQIRVCSGNDRTGGSGVEYVTTLRRGSATRRHSPPLDLSPRSARRRRGLLRFGEDRVDAGLDQFEHERDLAGDGICPGSRAAVGLPRRACSPDCVVRCQRNKCRINLRGDGESPLATRSKRSWLRG